MKTYEEYKELVLEQEQQSNSRAALEQKYAVLKKQYDALIDKQEGVEEKKTKAEEDIKTKQVEVAVKQNELNSKEKELEPLIDQEENIETQIATLEKKIEQLQLTFDRNKKAEGTATASDVKYGKELKNIEDKVSLKAQGKTQGLGPQTNNEHKSLAGFLSEGIGIGSDFDLDYAKDGGATGDTIHIRFVPKETTSGESTDIFTKAPVRIENGKVRMGDIEEYVKKNKMEFVRKSGAKESGVVVKLGENLSTNMLLPVDRDMIELGISEYDRKDGIVLEIILLPKYKTKLGSKTMGSLVDKVQGKFQKMKNKVGRYLDSHKSALH